MAFLIKWQLRLLERIQKTSLTYLRRTECPFGFLRIILLHSGLPWAWCSANWEAYPHRLAPGLSISRVADHEVYGWWSRCYRHGGRGVAEVSRRGLAQLFWAVIIFHIPMLLMFATYIIFLLGGLTSSLNLSALAGCSLLPERMFPEGGWWFDIFIILTSWTAPDLQWPSLLCL